jgi:hypothetical protein
MLSRTDCPDFTALLVASSDLHVTSSGNFSDIMSGTYKFRTKIDTR